MLRNVTCKTNPISRAKGQSAVAGAAYRAGQNLKARGIGPEGKDRWFRYGPRSVDVREAFIMAPDDAPELAQDRAELWNHIEELETRKNARLGRDVMLGLSYGLDHDEQRALVREFAQREFVDRGFVVDVAIHNYGRAIPSMGRSEEQSARIKEWAEAGLPFLSKEEAEGRSDVHVMEVANREGTVTGFKLYQPHAHVLVTPRVVEDGAFVKNKTASRELNKAEIATQWRYEWPKLQNRYLEAAGSDARVTSTSSEEDQFPDIRFLGSAHSQESHALDERAADLRKDHQTSHAEAVEAEAVDDAFRKIHNESIVDTFTQDEENTDAESVDKTRLALWWHRQSERFSQWRFDFKERAGEWQERLAQQHYRIRSVLGWVDVPEQDSGPGTTPDSADALHDPNNPKPSEPEL